MNRQLSLVKNLILVLAVCICIPVSATEFETIDMQSDWGIEPVHARITARGYMVEFRYRVLDTEKALIMSSRKVSEFPYLLAEKSKARLSVPYGSTVGFLKSNRSFLKKGKNYTAMFSNQGKHLLPGDTVRIQLKGQVSAEISLQ